MIRCMNEDRHTGTLLHRAHYANLDHKEESALLPLLADLLDEDADRALALAYAAS
jgi:hypothetical protein